MRKKALVLGITVILGVALWAFAPWGSETVEVETAPVTRGSVEEIVANTRAGTVKARRRSKLSPQTGGLVVALPYRKGAQVQAGELLLQLDDKVPRAQLELAEKQLQAAISRAGEACEAAELATRELARGQALFQEGYLSQQSLDVLQSRKEQSQAACRAAKALVEQSQAQVNLARAQLALTQLRAPFSGVIAELTTEVGEWITPSPPGVPIPPVIDLLDPESLYVTAPVDELDVARVKVGQKVRLSLDPRPGVVFFGWVTKLAAYVLDVAEQNRTAEVEVAFDPNSDLSGVLPGSSADVEIVVASKEGVLRIPTSAVGDGGKVLVLAKGRLSERRVQIGLANWQFTEVVEGLAEGEEVVVSRDRPEIREGVRARKKP
ncbi:MAG: efflux RND transporter periplasmic adaptor subunit [Thermoanaerobaculaceae bacterium]